jgi:hypothetical protein
MDRNRISSGFAAQQGDRFTNDFIHVDQLSLCFPLLEQGANPTRDFRRTGYILDDSRHGFAGFFDVRQIERQPFQTGLCVCDRRRDRLLDLVR